MKSINHLPNITSKSMSKNIAAIYPLTATQQGMLFHTLMHPGSGMYLQQYRHIMVMDNLNVDAFAKSWQAVVQRHEILRTCFVYESQTQPLQVVMKSVNLPFEYLDWSSQDEHQQQQNIEQLLADERQQGLPFNQAPLMHVRLIQLGENRYQFIRSYHHILMDAWCFSIIMTDFLQHYDHFADGQPLQLTTPARFEDYIYWLEAQDAKQQQNHWQQKLKGFDSPTSLGIYQPGRFKTDTQPLSQDVVSQLSPQATAQLQAIARQYQVTLNTLLQGAWAQTLSQYSANQGSANQDVLFGVTVAGRSAPIAGIETMVGLFINTLPLRCQLNQQQLLIDWLQQLQQDNLTLRDHEHTSLALIQQWSEVDNQPLFNSIFVYENAPMDDALALDNLSFKVEAAQNRSNLNYPLTVTVLPGEALHLELTYSCADFEPEAVKVMLNRFKQILLKLVNLDQPSTATLADIRVHSTVDMPGLIGQNMTAIATAPQLFSQQAKQQPQAIALIDGEQSLTYRELDQQSNALAHDLIDQHQVTADTLIGLCFERSTEMLVAMLAILKAGAAYVPLDPSYPEARLKYMVEDANLEIIISQQHLKRHLNQHLNQHSAFNDCQVILLSHLPINSPQSTREQAPQITIKPEHLAYVIYTSGTTGNPKGVMVEHQQLSNFLLNVEQRYRINPHDRMLQFSTINFDIAVEEIFGSLCFGAALVLRNEQCVTDPQAFFDLCEQQAISVVSLPTAFWHQLVANDVHQLSSKPPSTLRMVIVGGEALQVALTNHWFEQLEQLEQHKNRGIELVNTYGPTEATVTACGYHLTQPFNLGGDIPIGTANINTRLYVLDQQLNHVPFNVVGELYIGGDSVARGYLNRPALTDERFVQSPFGRLYRSGDLVRCGLNGQLEFVGRIDNQVKIRGFRIELAEIEAVLQQCAGVKQCLVIAYKKSADPKSTDHQTLVAYYTADAPIETLRQQLATKLADYMLPTAFMHLQSLPLTTNGKVDKQALPAPQVSETNQNPSATYNPPTNALEATICEVWQQLLDINTVSIDDNFFNLGGHSLLVIQLLAALRKRDVVIDAAQLFKTPTPAGLAAAITQGVADAPFVPPANLIPADCQQITPDMLNLVELTQPQIDDICQQTPGGVANVQDIYPLAPLQQGILFHHMVDPDNDPYVVSALLTLDNGAFFARFIEGLKTIIARHDVLRTAILWQNKSQPLQVVNRYAELDISWLTPLPGSDMISQISAYQRNENHTIDLEKASLLQLKVMRDSVTDQHAILFLEHHIIADHVGVDILIKELAAHLNGDDKPLTASVPYRHFVAYALMQNKQQNERQNKQQNKQNSAKDYFTDQLSDIDEPTTPFGLTNTQGGRELRECKTTLAPALSANIRQQAKALAVSPAAIFHAGWALVIARCCGQENIVFGTVMSGRLQGITGIETMLGMFINTLPLRVNLQQQSVQAFVQHISQSLHALVPFEQTSLALAQQCSGLSAEQSLFSAILNYRHSQQNQPLDGLNLLTVSERSNYPFGLSVDDFGADDNPSFALTLETDLSIDQQQIIGYINKALHLLTEGLSQTPQQTISTFNVLSDTEQQQQLLQWASTKVSDKDPRAIHQLFEQQAQLQPDACALIFNHQPVSYRVLDEQANQLAHLLQQHNETGLIGLCLNRSVEMVVAILAVLKTGGAYVPLDPSSPAQRLSFQIDDAQLTTVIADDNYPALTTVNTLMINSQATQQQLSQMPTSPVTAPITTTASPDSLAYIIYTSGTTGKPKGVMIEHAGIVNLVCHQTEAFGLSNTEVFIWLANYVFDASVEQLFCALGNGATLVLPQAEDIHQPDRIHQLMTQHQVSHLDGTPSYLDTLGDSQQLPLIKRVISGGEAITDTLLQRWGDKIINVYGPTEATVTAIQAVTQAPTKGAIQDTIQTAIAEPNNNIGRPIANTYALVLDKQLRLLPQGVAGELYLGGRGLARGYLNQADLSAEKFIANPFSNSGLRLYKTGDLVHWQKDGNLSFLGRVDHQVKIRGFRVELAEIEQTLLAHPAVTQALVIYQNHQLLAYVVAESASKSMTEAMSEAMTEAITEQALIADVKQQLPDYMLPTHWVMLEQMPLSNTGKIDRKALPQPDMTSMQHRQQHRQQHYQPPQTPSEIMLANQWQQLLNIEQIGRHDNFFELGGHSLLIMQLITSLQQLNIQVSAAQLFATPVLTSLAQLIDSQDQKPQTRFKAPANGITSGCQHITPDMLTMIDLSDDELASIIGQVPGNESNIQDIYPLAPLQQGILFHHMMDPENDPYVMPAWLRIQGSAAYQQFIAGLKQVIQRHDVLRTAILWRHRSQPVQVVYREVTLPITRIELDNNQDHLPQMQAYCAARAHTIDIEQAPLIALTVAHHPVNDEYVIQLVDHHVVSDHVGMEIIQQELALIFADQAAQLPTPVQYREFVAFAAHQAQNSDDSAFFTRLLGDINTPTLPFNLSNTQGNGQAIDEQEQQLPAHLSQHIREQAKQLKLSPAVLFHSALAMVVAACSFNNNGDDVVFGSVMSGRLQGVENASSMMGMFINTLPLRVKLHNQNATDLVYQVHQSLLDLIPYEQTSLALAQKCSGVDAELPLFSMILNYRHSAAHDSTASQGPNQGLNQELSNLKFIAPEERSNYPLSIAVDDFGEHFLVNVQIDNQNSANQNSANQNSANQNSATRVLSYIETALTVLIQQLKTPSTDKMAEQCLLPPAEREQLLATPITSTPVYHTVGQWFAATAQQHPERIALTHNDQQLSYQALDLQSNQLACYLQTMGVKSHDRVGLCLSRSFEMVISQLALFKLGAAFVPLDPFYPAERLNYTIKDSQISHLIAAQGLVNDLTLPDAIGLSLIDNQAVQQAISTQPSSAITISDTSTESASLAYVIYTSGSTGLPKGVMISQRALVNFLSAMNQQLDGAFSNHCRLLAVTTMAFDIAGLEIFAPLVHAGQVVLASKQDSMDGKALIQLIEQHDINCLQATPASWQMLAAQQWSGKTDLTALCGGEALPLPLAQFLLPRCERLFNCYGPTEATIWSLVQQVDAQQLEHGITIGGGLANYRHLVLNDHGQPVPFGAVGELVIGGPSLAEGYLNLPEKTAEVFVKDTLTGERLYRSGDLVRALNDNQFTDPCFEYIGRRDEQVKIRGFRIEPGEIEQQIIKVSNANLCHVIVRDDLLVAYLSNSAQQWADKLNTIKQHLQQVLPDYMMPNVFVPMDDWPLTPNGKVNKKALPMPEFNADQQAFVAPQTELQQQLAQIWATLLKLEVSQLSIERNFFELGGHSLLAMQLISQIESRFGQTLSLQTLFKSPTIAAMAAQITTIDHSTNDTLDLMDQLLSEFEDQ